MLLYVYCLLTFSYHLYTVATNIVEADIVQMNIDTSTSTVYCNLLGSYIETMDAVCSIAYGYPRWNCERYMDSSIVTAGRPGVNLTITLSQCVNIGVEFCYTVSLKYGVTTIKIVGNFTTGIHFITIYHMLKFELSYVSQNVILVFWGPIPPLNNQLDQLQ